MLIMLSCSDNVKVNESDLNKYPWLIPFIKECTDIKGIHNIDLGTIEFSCKISMQDYNKIFSQFDSIANIEQWKTLKMSKLKREFFKRVSQYDKDGGDIVINIEIDATQNRLFFSIK
jgi:hypothetical protein